MDINVKHVQNSSTAAGILWSSIERFSVQGVQLLITLVLARILSPSDYGLIAMLSVFIAVSQIIIDSGFANALIRKSDRSDVDFATVFYFNLVTSVIIYLLLIICAPIVEEFYTINGLTLVMRIYSVTIILNAFGSVHNIWHTIKLDFRTIAKSSLLGTILGGILGIVLAVNGFGVWALVYSSIATVCVRSVSLWFITPWHPSFSFSLLSLRTMFPFGSRLLLAGLLDTVYRNLYQLVIGRKFTDSDLGFYSRAEELAKFPSSNLTGIIQRVTYPVLCRIIDDKKNLLVAFKNYLGLTAYIIFPLMMGLAAVAKPLIIVVFGLKWFDSIILLQLLCFSMMWYPIHALNLNIMMAKGRSDLFFRVEMIKKAVGVCVLLITMNYSVVYMAVGLVISSMIALIINTNYAKKELGFGLLLQIRVLLPVLFLSSLSSLCAYLVQVVIKKPVGALACSIVIGILVYLFGSIILKNREYLVIKQIVLRLLKTKTKNP